MPASATDKPYWQPFIVKDPKTDEERLGTVREGDRVECPNGHRLGLINRTIFPGTNLNMWHAAVDFEGKAPRIGDHREDCRCPTCDAIWLWPYAERR